MIPNFSIVNCFDHISNFSGLRFYSSNSVSSCSLTEAEMDDLDFGELIDSIVAFDSIDPEPQHQQQSQAEEIYVDDARVGLLALSRELLFIYLTDA